MKSAVITGTGIVAPPSRNKNGFFSAINEFIAEAPPVTLFAIDHAACRYAHALVGLDALPGLTGKGFRSSDRNSKIAISAIHQAIIDARLTQASVSRSGLILGTEFGSLSSIACFDRDIQKGGIRGISPMQFQNTVINAPASRINIHFGIQGFSSTVSSSQTASIDALGIAAQQIQDGMAETIIAGGSEELSEEIFRAADNSSSLSSENKCYPFNLDKHGFLIGEGAAMFVVEDAEHAAGRNAAGIAEIIGYASGFRPHADRNENKTVARKVIEQCLKEARLTASDMDWIVCNASGDNILDETISDALSTVFNLHKTRVGTVKGITGETHGASGAFSIAGIIAMFEGKAIPSATVYYDAIPSGRPEASYENPPSNVRCAMAFALSPSGNMSAIILRNLL